MANEKTKPHEGQLQAALSTTDRLVARIDRLTSTTAGQERAFAALGYGSHALHHLLQTLPWIARQTRLSLLARLRQHQLPEKPSLPASPGATGPSPLLALSSLFSETRYTLRLFGLVGIWTWGVNTLRHPPEDKTLYTLTLLQVLANTLYQSLENIGFLASKGIVSNRVLNILSHGGGIDKLYLWSVRAWFTHIILQFVMLGRQHVLRTRRAAKMTLNELKGDKFKGEVRAWNKSLVNCLFWAPLALHWSLEKGVGVPGSVTGAGGFMAGAWGFYDLWGATA